MRALAVMWWGRAGWRAAGLQDRLPAPQEDRTSKWSHSGLWGKCTMSLKCVYQAGGNRVWPQLPLGGTVAHTRSEPLLHARQVPEGQSSLLGRATCTRLLCRARWEALLLKMHCVAWRSGCFCACFTSAVWKGLAGDTCLAHTRPWFPCPTPKRKNKKELASGMAQLSG